MSDRPADSGDPNGGRDKSKDIHIFVDGNDSPVATVYAGLDHPLVVWAVRGPQDAKQALQIAEGIIAALSGATPRVAPPAPPVLVPKARAMSAALREHILAGLDDEAVWTRIVEEFACGNDKRYRIKEYRKELEGKTGGQAVTDAPNSLAAIKPARLFDGD